MNVESLKRRLVSSILEHSNKSREYDELYEKHGKLMEEVRSLKQAVECFRECIDMYEEHLATAEKQLTYAAPADYPRLIQQF
jgi:hypothetical protein